MESGLLLPKSQQKSTTSLLKPLYISFVVVIFVICLFIAFEDERDSIKIFDPSIQQKVNLRQEVSFKSNDDKQKELSGSPFSTFELEVENEYGVGFKPLKHYRWLVGKQLVEPFRVTNLRLKNFESNVPNLQFFWKIGTKIIEGASVDYVFDKVGAHKVEFYSKNVETGAIKKILDTEVVSKYVRREIRSLSDDDRDKFLDALQKLYQVSTNEGKSLYGEDYFDISYFAAIHNALAGTKDCDHIHEGVGFLTNHAVYTMMFEKSLQAIDPSITVPYWDYTIEGHTVKKAKLPDSSAWFTSPVFYDDWFGAGGPENKFVNTGKWAYTPMIMNATSISPVTNAYGMLRSPWNLNNIPYVSRYNYSLGFSLSLDDIPNCKSHYDQLKKDTWSDFALSVEGAPHGSVHILIGGSWNTDWHTYVMSMGFSQIGSAFTSFSFAHGWRQEQITCPTYCSPSTPPQQCKCTCDEIEDWIAAGTGVMRAKIKKIAPKLFNEDRFFYSDDGTDVSEQLLRMLCNDNEEMTPFIGEMLTSAAPLDPLFWPMHPTLDRLWHWWRINELGTLDWDYDETACFGHNPDDILPYPTVFSNYSAPYSNKQLFDYLDPQGDIIPYTYDSFEWSHCKKEGYPLDLLPTGEDDDDDDVTETTPIDGGNLPPPPTDPSNPSQLPPIS